MLVHAIPLRRIDARVSQRRALEGAGADIFTACKEAVGLAKRIGRPVAFEFNGAAAIVHADSDPGDAAKRWWRLAYGKSYEQSMEDR